MKTFFLLLAFLATPAFAAPLPHPTIINVTASNMKGAEESFMSQFQARYADQSTKVPFGSLLYRASILPQKGDDAKRLDTTTAGGLRFASFANHGTTIVSDGNQVNNVSFPVSLMGQVSTVEVDFPAHIEIAVAVQKLGGLSQSLDFTFKEPIAFHTQNLKLGLPVPLPPLLHLQRVTVSADRIGYTFADDTRQYVLNLNISERPK